MIKIHRLDHLVLTVADIDTTCQFYQVVLGCEVIYFGDGRRALSISNHQKINLHAAASPLQPAACCPQPGSADLCFLTETALSQVVEHLQSCSISIIAGPVQRTGTLGPILSVYIRDPDDNLIEIANVIE